MVGYGEGELGFGGEWLRESDAEELGGTGGRV